MAMQELRLQRLVVAFKKWVADGSTCRFYLCRDSNSRAPTSPALTPRGPHPPEQALLAGVPAKRCQVYPHEAEWVQLLDE